MLSINLIHFIAENTTLLYIDVLKNFIIGTCFICIPYILMIFSNKLILCKWIKILFAIFLTLIGVSHYLDALVVVASIENWNIINMIFVINLIVESTLAFVSFLTIIELYAYAKIKLRLE